MRDKYKYMKEKQTPKKTTITCANSRQGEPDQPILTGSNMVLVQNSKMDSSYPIFLHRKYSKLETAYFQRAPPNHSWGLSIKEGLCLKVKWGMRRVPAATLMSTVF